MNNSTRVLILTLGSLKCTFLLLPKLESRQHCAQGCISHDFFQTLRLWPGKLINEKNKPYPFFMLFFSRLFACVWFYFTTIWVFPTDSLDHIASSGKNPDKWTMELIITHFRVIFMWRLLSKVIKRFWKMDSIFLNIYLTENLARAL